MSLWYTKFKKKAKHSFTVVKLDFTVNFSFRTVNYSYDSLTILFIFKMLIIVKSLQIVKLYLSDRCTMFRNRNSEQRLLR